MFLPFPPPAALHRLGASDARSSGPGLRVAGSVVGSGSTTATTAGSGGHPRLFVKPKTKSNRMVISNAISHCCLAGAVNEPMKQLTLKVSQFLARLVAFSLVSLLLACFNILPVPIRYRCRSLLPLTVLIS